MYSFGCRSAKNDVRFLVVCGLGRIWWEGGVDLLFVSHISACPIAIFVHQDIL